MHSTGVNISVLQLSNDAAPSSRGTKALTASAEDTTGMDLRPRTRTATEEALKENTQLPRLSSSFLPQETIVKEERCELSALTGVPTQRGPAARRPHAAASPCANSTDSLLAPVVNGAEMSVSRASVEKESIESVTYFLLRFG